MKTKSIALFITATCALSTISSAVTVTVAGIANSSVGLITSAAPTYSLFSGRAIFVSTNTAITAIGAQNSLLSTVGGTGANFDTQLNTLIGAGSPGIIRSATFTNGVLASTGSVEAGAVGNFTYLFLVAEASSNVVGLGAFTGPTVPSLGAVTFNPTNAGDTLGIGTSVKTGTSGFQLIPEPSVTLLGAIGALGLLRRRRI